MIQNRRAYQLIHCHTRSRLLAGAAAVCGAACGHADLGLYHLLHRGGAPLPAEEFKLFRILYEVFEEKARKAPDVLAALLPDGARQLGKALCLEHRVAAREGYVGEGVAHDFLHQFLRRGHRAVADVP